MCKIYISRSPLDTFKIGYQIAQHYINNYCALLIGNLGVGKSQLYKGIATYYRIYSYTPITYVGMKRIEMDYGYLVHIDLYRKPTLSILDDIDDDDNVLIIEWPIKQIIRKLKQIYSNVITLRIYNTNIIDVRVICLNCE